MMRVFYIFAFAFLTNATSFGQMVLAIDSLETRLSTATGQEKAITLYELVYAYLRVDVKKAQVYREQVKTALKSEKDPASLSYLHMANGIFATRSGHIDSGIMSFNE